MNYAPVSASFESFLTEVNAAVEALPLPLIEDPHLTAQIVGLPRSATTVLMQLLARTGAVGYPSNVMAFFHRAPWVGATLQARLAASGGSVSLDSTGGRTREPLDPHEFGYFWRRVCGHSRNSLVQDLTPPPPDSVQAELSAVGAAFDKPVVYKNFLALAHSAAMRRDLQGQRFISIKRDPAEVAASLLHLRRVIGARPQDSVGPVVEDEPESEGSIDIQAKVVRQVALLAEQERRCGFSQHQDSIEVDYEAMTRNPRGTVKDILAFLEIEAPDMTRVPMALDSRSSLARLEPGARQCLREAMAEALCRLTDEVEDE